MDIDQKDIENVLTSLVKRSNDELFGKSQSELENYWLFNYSKSHSKEWNLYQFTKALELYKSQCRKWEEYHNGNACVVERVRDQYLMPKIKSFVEKMTGVES